MPLARLGRPQRLAPGRLVGHRYGRDTGGQGYIRPRGDSHGRAVRTTQAEDEVEGDEAGSERGEGLFGRHRLGKVTPGRLEFQLARQAEREADRVGRIREGLAQSHPHGVRELGRAQGLAGCGRDRALQGDGDVRHRGLRGRRRVGGQEGHLEVIEPGVVDALLGAEEDGCPVHAVDAQADAGQHVEHDVATLCVARGREPALGDDRGRPRVAREARLGRHGDVHERPDGHVRQGHPGRAPPPGPVPGRRPRRGG